MKGDAGSENKKIGLIAGRGSLPVCFAENARAQGDAVFATTYEKRADLAALVKEVSLIPIGQIEKIVSYFKTQAITTIVMAGSFPKTALFDAPLDNMAQSLLRTLSEKKDDDLLRAFASLLEKEGIAVAAITDYLPSLLATEGEMTRPLTPDEKSDIRWGWRLAKQIGALDIGQCVIVRDGVILAVEAIEGTDAAIARGGTLGRDSAVVIKCLKPHQDLRFDLPTVGLNTIQTMIDVRASVLAVEAHATLLLDKERMLKAASDAGIAVVGWTEHG